MIRRLLRRVRPADDRGALLIIAIVIVTVVALVTGFVLTQGDGSLRATVALRDVARAAYAADGAAQVAINDLRTGYNVGSGEPTPWYYTNEVGTGCFGYDGAGALTTPKDSLVLDNLIPKLSSDTQGAMSAVVECTPEDATGAQGSAVPINNGNKPGNAILTLGTSGAENGFKFKTNGSGGAFRVRGGIWSNSNILRDNNGNLESSESIRAHTGCTPASAMVAPIVNCSAGTVADPNYPSELDLAGSGIPTLQTVPACSSGTATLQPGWYDNAAALSALTPNGGSSCFIHMTPGVYYFDFHNSTTDPLYDADIATNNGNSGSVWTINSGTIVGGTLTSDTSIPGRCVNPIDDVAANGVQIIFGGDSRMLIDKGAQVELCATYHAARPPIALHEQKTGTAIQTVIAPADALTTNAAPTVTPAGGGGDGTFTGATMLNVQTVNGNQTTDANLAAWRRTTAGGNNETRSITMTGFSPTTTLPPGTVLTAARLKVTHRSTGTQNQQKNSFTLTPNLVNTGDSPLTYTLTQNTGAAANLGTEDVDLSGVAGWGAFQKAVHDRGFTGASVQFGSTLGKSQLAQLDAVRLELTYYLPALRGQTTSAIPNNVVATVGGTPVVSALGNTTFLYVQGTTYTPLASIKLELNNIQESVFRFGVIARALDVFETASFSYPGAVIELPDNSPGFGFERTIVQLKVYLCPGVTSGCTTGTGELTLTARVELFDEGGVAGPPNREITVLSWSHSR